MFSQNKPPTTFAVQRFHLVELLVVIAIIGILVALLLPAVQAAREAARRAQCTNNLKQFGLAMHNYHTSLGQFAPGWTEDNNEDRGLRSNIFAWGVHLLPYLEEQPLYDAFDFDLPANSGTPGGAVDNIDLIGTPLEIFRCPSDDGPDTEEIAGLGSFYPHIPALATSNYVGSGSTCLLCFAGHLPDILPGGSEAAVGCPLAEFGGFVRHLTRPNGVVYRNSDTRVRDIVDGTTYTFLIGERFIGKVADPGSGNAFWSTASWPTVPGQVSNQLACFAGRLTASLGFQHARKSPMINGHVYGFNSRHPGGVQVVLCDGSVRFVQDSVDRTITEFLIRINDGTVIDDF